LDGWVDGAVSRCLTALFETRAHPTTISRIAHRPSNVQAGGGTSASRRE
jgi:hypothetical protein